MPITNGYTDLATIKVRMGINDEINDPILEALIEAVSRQIDDYCGRRFFAVSETRYYTPIDADTLWVDDLLSVTTLQSDEDGDRTYEVTWASTDYDLEPANAALDGKPYSRIAVAPDGDYTFPTGVKRGVKVVGSFGYSTAASTPKPVKEACLIQCSRLYHRKDAPFGVAGSPEVGQATVIARLDPDVKFLLSPYRLIEVG